MTQVEHLDVVCNPTAGRGRAAGVAGRVCDELRDRGITSELHTPPSREHTGRLLDQLAGSGRRTVVVGGDGLVHLAASAFAASQTPLGLVPGGTGNDFAGALGLPSEVPEAVDRALETTEPVDLLAVDGTATRVATVATFGFSAAVNERAERMRWPRGSSKYTAATLLESVALTRHRVTLDIDGDVSNHDVTLVAIANTSRFGGGMEIAPTAVPFDGSFDVVLIGVVPRRTLLRVLPRAFSGRHIDHPAVTVMRGRRIAMDADTKLSVRGDGEAIGESPLHLTTERGSLLVAGVERPRSESAVSEGP